MSLKTLEQIVLTTPAAKQWNSIGVKPHHGIALTVSSLHSHSSAGIGEYLDLLPLLPWIKEIGMDVIQLLPLNDSGLDASPYNAISAYALNPAYLKLSALPFLEDYPEIHNEIETLKKVVVLYGESQRVNYSFISQEKHRILKEYCLRTFHHWDSNSEFNSFKTKHQSWLKPYALFKELKSLFGWKSWMEWDLPFKDPTSNLCELDPNLNLTQAINIHSLIQFLCFQQMKEVKKQASNLNLLIKGDIPILISPDSADVWFERTLFDLTHSAGAPPDMYNHEGQQWGFPLYNWPALAETNYAWWRQRLEIASEFYHLYRIDHVVGFFRIWGIPRGHKANEGYFIPKNTLHWVDHGRKLLLMMLESSPLLPIGEDLGTIPNDVRICLRLMGICGTKVMRWERMWQEDSRFISFEDYIPESMTTVSTHDSETLQLWWLNQPKEVVEFIKFKGWDHEGIVNLNEIPKELPKNLHYQILWDSHHTGSLFHINLLQEYLSLCAGVVWPHIEDERINIPGTVSDFNWTYRFKLSVEELVGHEELKKIMQSML